MDAPLVSICCQAYNHEKYIGDAIEGFLMQKTDFPYEIFIHDDASTDATADIIRSYARGNPCIIPIIQTENQMSKGVNIAGTFIFPKLRGKYIALCEGDDYWTDPCKLQKQINYMEAHPECSLCVHASSDISASGEFIRERRRRNSDCVIPSVDVILRGGGHHATSSVVYPSRFALTQRPSYFKKAPVGDVPLQLFLASHGEIYYLRDNMSVYRTAVPGSWSLRVASGSYDKRLDHVERLCDMYMDFDKSTEYKYHRIIKFHIDVCTIHIFRYRRLLKMPGTGIFAAALREAEYFMITLSMLAYRFGRKICGLK